MNGKQTTVTGQRLSLETFVDEHIPTAGANQWSYVQDEQFLLKQDKLYKDVGKNVCLYFYCLKVTHPISKLFKII